MPNPTVAICVPTYLRPHFLQKLLDAVEKLDTEDHVLVVVADNDATKAEGLAVAEARKAGYRFPLVGVVVEERGISAARNALIREAKKVPSVSTLVMIDDDEWPTETWLKTFMAAKAQTGADILAGPVFRFFESDPQPPQHYIEAETVKSKSDKTERIRSIEATSNILFDMKVFAGKDDGWFDPAFSITGGEDRDFLLGERLKGRTFAWAADALVYETMPSSRCTEQWSIQRAYRVGNSEMIAYLKHRPPYFVLKEFVKINLAFAQSLSHAVFFWSRANRFKAKRISARAFGKIAALGGKKYYEYKTIHGS